MPQKAPQNASKPYTGYQYNSRETTRYALSYISAAANKLQLISKPNSRENNNSSWPQIRKQKGPPDGPKCKKADLCQQIIQCLWPKALELTTQHNKRGSQDLKNSKVNSRHISSLLHTCKVLSIMLGIP